MAGYSGTPLVQKLGIKPGCRLMIIREPPGFRRELPNLPSDVEFLTKGTELDVIICFARDRAALDMDLSRLKGCMAQSGMLWVAWPKKASGMASDLDENLVRTIGLAASLVDIKVCAVNDVWSGLKFVIPVKDRSAAPKR